MQHKGSLNHKKHKLILVILALLLAGGVNFQFPTTLPVSAQAIHVCRNRVDILPEDMHWLYVPESADQLYTEERYYYLAGQLIKNEVVDASSCPLGGLQSDGYANACGMSVAFPTVIIVQNLVNEPILQAWKDVGVPPVLLKQLIRYESQFWPDSPDEIHYGYGHITNIGIRNAMQWNIDLYREVCPATAIGSCVSDTAAADQILNSLIATCPTCEYGINIEVANRTVNILAEALMGYCYQTAQLAFNATGWRSNLVLDYATVWKLTLMNYNGGSQCVYDTLVNTFEFTEGPIRWPDISANISGNACVRGLAYANQITAKAFPFPPE